MCAPPRSLSQLITSFFASETLGIPHTPFSCSFLFLLSLSHHVNVLLRLIAISFTLPAFTFVVYVRYLYLSLFFDFIISTLLITNYS